MHKAIYILILLLVLGFYSTSTAEIEKSRVIVLTDISNEPDDEESMVRFLVYANEYDVEGLIANLRVVKGFHPAGPDPAAGQCLRQSA